MIEAVVFDLDGVLIDSEQVWDAAREQLVRERGGRWHERAQRDMMGMSSNEWSRYMHDELGLPEPPEEINEEVVRRMTGLLPRAAAAPAGGARGGRAARRALAARACDLVEPADPRARARARGRGRLLPVTVSSEEVGRGKPAPDVYLEAARRLGVAPERCAAIEDSHNGIRSAHAAGMRVVAIPNREFPPDAEALGLADVVLESLDELRPEVVGG